MSKLTLLNLIPRMCQECCLLSMPFMQKILRTNSSEGFTVALLDAASL
jgi:hypothetical protein